MDLDEMPLNMHGSQGKTFEELLENELNKSPILKPVKNKINKVEKVNKNLNIASPLINENVNNIDTNSKENIPKKTFLKRGEGKNVNNINIQTKQKNNYYEESTDYRIVNNNTKIMDPD